MWEAGRTGQPMQVESQRKLTMQADDKMQKKKKQLKPAHDELKRAEREREQAVRRLAELQEEAAEAAALGLEENAETMMADPQADFAGILSGEMTLSDDVDFSLSSLRSQDLPLRLVFVDKSGSMGCDKNTLSALCLSTQHALNPTVGSCLLVLLAAPGETQFYFSRVGDPPRSIEVPLGCCTWYSSHLTYLPTSFPSLILD